VRRELTPIKGTAGKEFDHLALRIDLEDIGLADLSFGDNFLEPLRLSEMEQRLSSARLSGVAPSLLFFPCLLRGSG